MLDLLFCKRITALPGDIVVNSNKALTVLEGCYFSPGDNESSSIDSRHWDEPFLEKGKIIVRVFISRQRP